MAIRAILRNGHIEPTEPLPASWADGQELMVEEPAATASGRELDEWGDELDAATARISPEDHQRFQDALIVLEKESKDAITSDQDFNAVADLRIENWTDR